VAGVGDLVGLDDETERVAEEERQHDRHQDHRRLLATFPEEEDHDNVYSYITPTKKLLLMREMVKLISTK
jgi:hypothetical protein